MLLTAVENLQKDNAVFKTTQFWLESTSRVATIFGVPGVICAILVFAYQVRNNRRTQEYATYIETGEKYINYLTLCLDHPELDGFEVLASEEEARATGLDVQHLTLLSILISILEMAFLLYRRHGNTVESQDWDAYSRLWARRPDFRQAWPLLGKQFVPSFTEYMDELIRENTPSVGPSKKVG